MLDGDGCAKTGASRRRDVRVASPGRAWWPRWSTNSPSLRICSSVYCARSSKTGCDRGCALSATSRSLTVILPPDCSCSANPRHVVARPRAACLAVIVIHVEVAVRDLSRSVRSESQELQSKRRLAQFGPWALHPRPSNRRSAGSGCSVWAVPPCPTFQPRPDCVNSLLDCCQRLQAAPRAGLDQLGAGWTFSEAPPGICKIGRRLASTIDLSPQTGRGVAPTLFWSRTIEC